MQQTQPEECILRVNLADGGSSVPQQQQKNRAPHYMHHQRRRSHPFLFPKAPNDLDRTLACHQRKKSTPMATRFG